MLGVGCTSYIGDPCHIRADSRTGITDWPSRRGYGTNMARKCTRQGCVHPASATLSYQYARSLVWLDDLSEEADPHCYDLCEKHADRTRPPSGWHLEDRRHRVHVYEPGRLAAG